MPGLVPETWRYCEDGEGGGVWACWGFREDEELQGDEIIAVASNDGDDEGL